MTASTPASPAPDGPLRALGFEVVEWFHDPVLAAQLSRRHWRRLPTRAAHAVDAALAACAQRGVRATFFVLGRLAEAEPELVRRIAAAGHEVASAGFEPLDLAAVTPGERAAVLGAWDRARQLLEGLTGQAVFGFRSPWPVRSGEAWWRPALLAAGYRYDATDVAASANVPTGLAVPTGHSLARDPGAAAVVLPAWHLDAASPQLVGLPARVLRDHRAPLATAAAALATALAAQPRRTFAEALGLDRAPAPPRAVAPPPRPAVTAPRPARPDLPRLAIVVPLKDEAPGLRSLVQELDALRGHFAELAALEFVLVDDGSTDATWPLLQELLAARPDVRLVQHPHNLGLSAAIRTGMLATDAPLLASIDGDLSYDPVELVRMLPLLDGADVVTASPYHRTGGVKNVPGWRLSLSRTLSWCYQRLLRSEVSTWTSCFRLYRRTAVIDLELENRGFLGTAELLVRVLRRGGVVCEHPCVLEARLFGLSKMKIARTIRGHLRLLWRVARGRIR